MLKYILLLNLLKDIIWIGLKFLNAYFSFQLYYNFKLVNLLLYVFSKRNFALLFIGLTMVVKYFYIKSILKLTNKTNEVSPHNSF